MNQGSNNKRTPLVAGNWKMNGLKDSIAEMAVLDSLLDNNLPAKCEILICPPFTLLVSFNHILSGTKIIIGAQDSHWAEKGAHTGDISPLMLADAGCEYVIVGHSERRSDHYEDSSMVLKKAEAVINANMKAIICVGESEKEREAGATLRIIENQLKKSTSKKMNSQNTVIAYEPVWAIGTGKTASVKNVEEVHNFIRMLLCERFGEDGNSFRILYGGSVKAANAKSLMGASNVDGALVGGASLKANDFNGIITAYRK